jgi:hypothetical protein
VPVTPIPTSEAPEPIVAAAEFIAEPLVEVVEPIAPTTAPDADTVAWIEDAAEEPPALAAPPLPAADPPLTPAQQDKAARQALTDDLADVIHSVLSNTQFATKALKPKRYSEEPLAEEPDPDLSEFAEELAASLPHPVAIASRFGRLERGLAFASVGLMVVVGYFAFSLWHDAGSGPKQPSAVAVAAPHSEDRGARARDITRELGSIAVVTDVPKVPVPGPDLGTANPGARPQDSQSAE